MRLTCRAKRRSKKSSRQPVPARRRQRKIRDRFMTAAPCIRPRSPQPVCRREISTNLWSAVPWSTRTGSASHVLPPIWINAQSQSRVSAVFSPCVSHSPEDPCRRGPSLRRVAGEENLWQTHTQVEAGNSTLDPRAIAPRSPAWRLHLPDCVMRLPVSSAQTRATSRPSQSCACMHVGRVPGGMHRLRRQPNGLFSRMD